jgi:membrane protease YdiL (CAAX protease family)
VTTTAVLPSGATIAPRAPLTGRVTWALLALLVAVSVATIGGTVLILALGDDARALAVPMIAVMLVVHAAAMLTTISICLRRAGSRWVDLGFIRPTRRLLHLLWQIPLLLIALVATQAVVAVVVGGSPTPTGSGVDGLLRDAPIGLLLPAVLAIVIATPIWEEAVFRGLIYGWLQGRCAVLGAAAISAAAFAAVHVVPVLLPYLFVMGFSLALLRQFHRTLWAPVVTHAVVNALASSVLILALLR